ncbi:MAG: hypothetical protein IT494_08410 [Gammaproteobacteria bacterium]|nr:hypothetical protein [Gammaproteobacteria bacterium]
MGTTAGALAGNKGRGCGDGGMGVTGATGVTGGTAVTVVAAGAGFEVEPLPPQATSAAAPTPPNKARTPRQNPADRTAARHL